MEGSAKCKQRSQRLSPGAYLQGLSRVAYSQSKNNYLVHYHNSRTIMSCILAIEILPTVACCILAIEILSTVAYSQSKDYHMANVHNQLLDLNAKYAESPKNDIVKWWKGTFLQIIATMFASEESVSQMQMRISVVVWSVAQWFIDSSAYWAPSWYLGRIWLAALTHWTCVCVSDTYIGSILSIPDWNTGISSIWYSMHCTV